MRLINLLNQKFFFGGGDSRGVFDAFTEPTSASLIVDQSAVLICSGGPAGLAAAIAAARLTRSELRFA